jgi:hypothetical protein
LSFSLLSLSQSAWRPEPDDIRQLDVNSIATTPGSEIFLEHTGKHCVLFDFGNDKFFDWSKAAMILKKCVALMVFVSIGDFDVVDEKTQMNVFDDQLRNFWNLAEDPSLEGKHFIIILNKGDLFKKKIVEDKKDPRTCSYAFEGYSGPMEFESLVAFVTQLFSSRNNKKGRIVSCYLSHSHNDKNLENLFTIIDNFVELKTWDDITTPASKCSVM